jgi:hypothetical protein
VTDRRIVLRTIFDVTNPQGKLGVLRRIGIVGNRDLEKATVRANANASGTIECSVQLPLRTDFFGAAFLLRDEGLPSRAHGFGCASEPGKGFSPARVLPSRRSPSEGAS